MKIITKDFHISTRSHCEFVDITSDVASAVSKSGVKDGDAIILSPYHGGHNNKRKRGPVRYPRYSADA
jgi:thiamine phosphate synthase YjbQ (UPF0047 family)